jgi:hypothetical protein
MYRSMQYKNVVNNCLSRFLSEYKITEFYNKISSNVGAKVHDVEGCNHRLIVATLAFVILNKFSNCHRC